MLTENDFKDKGGRPKKNFIKDKILFAMNDLKRARAIDVYNYYKKNFKEDPDFSYKSTARYMEDMSKNGDSLKRKVLADNSNRVKAKKVNRQRKVCIYTLNYSE